MGLRTIEQKINAGHQFDGTAPGGNPTVANDLESFAAANTGGLFDFGNTQPIYVKQLQFIFGGQQASWKLEVLDVDNTLVTVLSGTNEVTVSQRDYNLILLRGQKLKLTTVTASAAMRARITATTKA